MLPDEAEAIADIHRRYSAAFLEMNRTLHAALMVVRVDEWTIRPLDHSQIDMRVIRVAQVLLAKALKTFRATQVLCEHGLGQDAGVLLRSLFETTLQVLWLFHSDSRRRARLIVAHQALRQDVILRELSELGVLGEDYEVARVLLDEQLETVTEDLSTEDLAGIERHWGGGVQSVCIQLKAAHPGLLQLYSLIYRKASGYAHGADTFAHASVDEAENFKMHVSPGDWDLTLTPRIARLLLVGLVAEIDERLGLGFKATLDAVRPPQL